MCRTPGWVDWGLLSRPPAVPFSSYLHVIRLPYGNVGGVPLCFFKKEIKKKICPWLFSQSTLPYTECRRWGRGTPELNSTSWQHKYVCTQGLSLGTRAHKRLMNNPLGISNQPPCIPQLCLCLQYAVVKLHRTLELESGNEK